MNTKKSMIQKGLGWGNLTKSEVQHEIAVGNLVEIYPTSWQDISLKIPMVAVYKKTIPISKTAQKSIDWFKNILNEETAPSPV